MSYTDFHFFCEIMTSSSNTEALNAIKKDLQKFEKTSEEKLEESQERLPFRLTYLTPALIEEAKTQLSETDETRKVSLIKLRKLIEDEKNLVAPTDDLFLSAFLRVRKYNIKKAFRLFQKYWSFRKEYKHIFDNINPDTVTELLFRDFLGYLHYRDRKGALVFVFKLAMWNPQIDVFHDLVLGITALLVLSLEYPASHIAGMRVIFDLRNLTWLQIKYITPSNVILLIRSTQFCFPARFKGVHVLSDSKTFNFIWTIAYPFLTAKLKKRIQIHGEDLKPLLEYIHPSVLPEEFGGEAPTFETKSWREIVDERVQNLLDMAHCGYQN